jgi:undecaprenyl-diphosphatase
MSAWYLVLLALLQGITEFLPISSSAHLILLPNLVDMPDQGLVFDVAANTGTLLAVVVYFHRDLLALARSLFSPPAVSDQPDSRRLVGQLAVASLPVLACGWLFRDLIATWARDPLVIAGTSIVYGLFLAAADRWGRRSRDLADLGWGDALFVGLAQALALVPGTSRAGVTLTAGLARGLDAAEATRFSFLLAIPVSAAAAAYESLGLIGTQLEPGVLRELLLVVAVSAAAGFAVIHLFLGFVRRQRLTVFVAYRLLLGAAILIWVR